MSQSEPTALDREMARAVHFQFADLCGCWTVTPPVEHCRVCNAIARALAAERARVESEWRYGHLADSTGHQHTCAKVNGVWACAKGCAQAKLARVLTLTPDEAGRLLFGSACCGNPTDEIMKPHYNETAMKFLAALTARAEGA